MNRREFIFGKFTKKPEKEKSDLGNKKDDEKSFKDKKVSRRDFLKVAGIATGALALGQIGIETSEAREKTEKSEKKEKLEKDWEEFVYGFCKEDPEKIEEMKNILAEIWGEGFNPKIDFYTQKKEDDLSFGFMTFGLYSRDSNTIKMNRFILEKINNRENALSFLDAVFHESGHADFGKDNYYFLEEISQNLELTKYETYNILTNSKILNEDKRKIIEQSLLVYRLIDEVHASFGEVYAGVKINDKYSFPLEEFLAEHSLFNRVGVHSSKDLNEEFFYKSSFNSSIYFSVEFLSLLLIEDFGHNLEKLRDFMKKSDFKDIALKIFKLYYKFKREKMDKMGADFLEKTPSELYVERMDPKSEILKKEEDAVYDFFENFSHNFSQRNGLKKGLLKGKAEKFKEEGLFKNLSVHIFDEILSFKNFLEKDVNQEIREITPEEKELLGIMKDLYLMFISGGQREDVKNKLDETTIKLEEYLKKDSFSKYTHQIEEEIKNIDQIYKKMFKIQGLERRR